MVMDHGSGKGERTLRRETGATERIKKKKTIKKGEKQMGYREGGGETLVQVRGCRNDSKNVFKSLSFLTL